MLEQSQSAGYLKKARLYFVPFLQSKRGYTIFSLFLGAACAIAGYFFFPLPGLSRLLSAAVFLLGAFFLSFTGYLLQQFRAPQHKSRLHIATLFTGILFAAFYIFFQPSVGFNGVRALLVIGIGTLASHLFAYPLARQTGSAMKRYPWVPKLLVTFTALLSFAGLVYVIATDNIEDLFSFFVGYPWVLIPAALFLLPLGYALFSKQDFKKEMQPAPVQRESEKGKDSAGKRLEEIQRQTQEQLEEIQSRTQAHEDRAAALIAETRVMLNQLEESEKNFNVLLGRSEKQGWKILKEHGKDLRELEEGLHIGAGAAPPAPILGSPAPGATSTATASRRGSLTAGSDPHLLPLRKNTAEPPSRSAPSSPVVRPH
jgi:hypothetical protein